MEQAAMRFFQKDPGIRPLYEKLESRMRSEIADVMVSVQPTQISFARDHTFACVSFARLGRAEDSRKPRIVLTFKLNKRISSPRVQVFPSPHLNRWTHHTTVSTPGEIDAELLGWLKEASSFAAEKPSDGGFFPA